MNDRQAWLRFALGLVALAGVVWGARGNIDGVRTKADSAYIMAYDNSEDIEQCMEDIHDGELRDKETEIRQQNIMSTLGRIELKLDTLEVVD